MKVIKRALSILDIFLDHTEQMSLDDMVSVSGLNKTTVRRMASTLVECGYLKQTRKRGKYSLGTKFLDFSGIVKMNNIIIPVATPYLIHLRQLLNESVQMAVWDGMRPYLCQPFLAEHPLKVVPEEGNRLVMHASSLGKAIIATWPEQDMEKHFNGKLEGYTPNTITDLNDLKKHLMAVKNKGIAFDDEECYLGIRGVAAALFNSEGKVVGAISIFGPTIRLTRERIDECISPVKECALKISRDLGYKG
ncbi:MAG: IclR family transcriptional regulator [Dehalococcoidales bacterium]|nr:IclR family transcriptional regulator [Dehalococcoidales bacterium]